MSKKPAEQLNVRYCTSISSGSLHILNYIKGKSTVLNLNLVHFNVILGIVLIGFI